jgi:hypothetical protein
MQLNLAKTLVKTGIKLGIHSFIFKKKVDLNEGIITAASYVVEDMFLGDIIRPFISRFVADKQLQNQLVEVVGATTFYVLGKMVFGDTFSFVEAIIEFGATSFVEGFVMQMFPQLFVVSAPTA